MKIYSITIPLKIIVNCLDYDVARTDATIRTSSEKLIELDIHARGCKSEEDAIKKVKWAIEALINDETSVGLQRNEEDY